MSSKETKKRKTKGQEGITKKKKKVQAQDGEEDVDAEDTAPLSIKKKKSKNVEATGDKEDAKEAETFSQPKKTKRGGKRKRRQRATLEHIRATPRVETFVHDEKSRKKFADFDLDERILKGIGELGWVQPTDVQLSMIGLALEGRNIMARARTGSGKTAAFVLPTLQRVLQVASTTSGSSAVSPGPLAIYIAPSKELATQVVATPGKLSTLLKLRPDFLAEVKHVVLDEADLLLSFGYESEMKFIRGGLPSHYQCILTSATLTDDMSQLKTLFMTGPVVTIKLKEGDLPDASQLTQYQLSCLTDEERFAILLAIIKLRLIVGKTIIFVNTTDRCYKLNIFLAAFSIRSCILNAAMPANSRCHVINEFNKGLYPIVVASDASVVAGQGPLKEDEDGVEVEPKKGVGRRKLDKESGVARGIDFHRVSNVINFDFPTSLDKYIHRVGRTARGFNKGTALSFCTPEETKYLEKVKTEMTKQLGEDVLSPYEMRIRELDSFVLRAREALNACTKMVIREARLAEIRMEALRSAKLQAYFAKNPREKDLLERDKKLHSLNLHCPAIGDVPDYIVPKALRGLDYGEDKKTGRRNGQKHRRKVIRTIRILYYLMAEKVKRYEKIKHLGEGQFANVYKAKDLEKGDIVAIKKIKLGSRSEIMDGVNRTALREIKLLQELDHENIIGLRDVIGGKMNIQLVMDFMETDLEHVVKDASIILLSSHIKNIVLQTLLGLEFLHENWILHRDLKPNNLLMNARGRIKIADFGLARYFGSPNRVLTHQVVTRWYRAPELIFAANSYGVGVDMWAIGCIVAELLLRNPLFPGESDLDQLQKIVQVMGSPTQQSWPEMTSLHDFVRISIPPHPCPDEELPLPARVTGKPQLSKRRRMNGTSPPGLRRKLVFD